MSQQKSFDCRTLVIGALGAVRAKEIIKAVDKHMEDAELFALKTRKDTDEKHLFLNKKVDNECHPNGTRSICKKMKRSEASATHFICASAQAARIECAKIGEKVCGTCVSHLYATYA